MVVMNLHRADKRPEWESISSDQWNYWQKVAASTHSIVTPANIISVIGLALVLYGLGLLFVQAYIPALILLVVGRLLDLVDGIVAHATGTKSPLGEIMDASIDKIGTLLTILCLAVLQIAPWWVLLALFLPHLIISAIVFAGRSRNVKLHPSRIGKLSMAVAWVVLTALLLIKAVGLEWPALLVVATYTLAISSSLMGLISASQYLRQIVK
ncbi:MAG: CDP-diacylglycerol--glycerol-3-phosphate3-phosphatidyltransferase [Candidatus Saccharibacteria bacterium]|nr:CDP-diacylglycerol--glycerol-3-phosphate3-phosphatidyltransferase [Candidatus Saccharibacteria bacterium]